MNHKTVLLYEAIYYLNIKINGIYIDATFGNGGHSKLILQHIGNKGRLFAIDKDPMQIKVAQKLAKHDSRVQVCHDSFKNIKNISNQNNIVGKIDGILLDLGLLNTQITNPIRGFSFIKNGPLDMRIDYSRGKPLSYWLNKANKKNIVCVLKKFGNERYAKKNS